MIAAGSDGNLWFTLEEIFAPNSIGRITPAGVITNFPLTSGVGPGDITAGPDGNVWFTELSVSKVGRITPAGVVTEYSLPLSFGPPEVITAGPDGNLWIASSTEIVVVSVSGAALSRIRLPGNVNGPFGIATGPDRNVWFTLPFAGSPTVSLRSEICRVNLTSVAGVAVPGLTLTGLVIFASLLALLGLLVLRRG
jgi:streptogramin lyase